MKTKGKRKYQMSAFAHYLSGILYELDGDFDNAYISYKKVLDLNVGYMELGVDLWRAARLSGRREDLKKWESRFKITEQDKANAFAMKPRFRGRGAKSEIVVFFENGISPRKRPNPHFTSVPMFVPRHNPVSHGRILLNGSYVKDTAELDDVEKMAIKNLDEKYGEIVAKKMAGVVIKESVSYGVAKATDNPLLGLLTRVVLYAVDQADVRSWNLLPKELHIARLVVEPGEHVIEIDPVGDSRRVPPKTVRVRPGKKAFVSFRYMPR